MTGEHRVMLMPDVRHFDPLDPILKDMKGDKAVRAFMSRFQAWSSKQPGEVRDLHCSHGRYIGYEGALRFLCPTCCLEDSSIVPYSGPQHYRHSSIEPCL
jgi:hypothetical protein